MDRFVRKESRSADDVRGALIYPFDYYNSYNLFEARENHLQTKYKLQTGFCELYHKMTDSGASEFADP